MDKNKKLKVKAKSKVKAKPKLTRKKSLQVNKNKWEKFLKNKKSREILIKSWDAKDPQTYYNKAIRKLSKEYSKKKS